MWWEQPNRLMQLDLADPDAQPTLHQAVDLPPVTGMPPGEPRLMVARGGTAVIARVEATPSPFGGPDTLYAVRGPGAPSPLGQADANSPVTVARLSPDGASLAYALYRSTDTDCGTAAIVMAGADGAQQTYDVAGPDVNTGSGSPKLWWPATGTPRLSLATWRCDRPETYTPLVWQLADNRIAQVTPPTAALTDRRRRAGSAGADPAEGRRVHRTRGCVGAGGERPPIPPQGRRRRDRGDPAASVVWLG